MSKGGDIQKLEKEKLKLEANGQWKEAASMCNYIGQELCKLGQFKEALLSHEEELNICTDQNDKLGIAVANRRIGECYLELNQFKKSLRHLKTFLELASDQKSVVEEQRAWASLGRAYYFKYLHETDKDLNVESRQKDLDKAEQAYMKGYEFSVSLKDQISAKEYAEMRSRLLLNLGLVFERRGNLTKCAESIRHAIFLTKKYNLNEDLHRCQYSLASVYQVCGQYNYALRLLDESVSTAKLLHDKTLINEAFVAKASILMLLKDFNGARRYFKKAFKLKTPILTDQERIEKHLKSIVVVCKCEYQLLQAKDDLSSQRLLYEKMGDALASAECYKVAIEYYLSTLRCLEALKASSEELAAIYFSLAQTYSDLGKFEEALKYFWKEVEMNIDKPIERIKTLWKIAEITFEQGMATEAENTYLKAFDIAENLNDRKYVYSCLKRLKSLYKKDVSEDKYKEVTRKLKELDRFGDIASDESETEDSEQLYSNINLNDLSDSTDSDVEKELYDSKRPKRSVKRSDHKRNELGETPLHRACITGDLNIVQHLVNNGHPVNTRDNCGWLPLHEACNYGYYEIVKFLLEKGALINDRGGKLCDGITPLHDSAACGNLDVMELLISEGASVTALNNVEETPIDCLLKWWERSREDLDPETVKQFKSIQLKLKHLMEQAGVDTENCSMDYHIPSKKDLSEHTEKSDIANNSPSRLPEKRNHSSSSSSDDGIDAYINPHLDSDRANPLNDPQNARAEYQAVMSAFRKKGQSTEPSKNKLNDKPCALLDENSVVTDWLIKDVVTKPHRTNKKQRKCPKLNVCKTNHTIHNFLTRSESDCDSARSISPSSNIMESSINLDNIQESACIEPESSKAILSLNVPVYSSSSHYTAKDTSGNLFCLRICIDGKVILVPVPDDNCKVEWLAEEAAQRFHNLVGSKPHLLLMNKDGALLSSSDLIKAVLRNNEEVVSTVVSWDHPSLLERYQQTCIKNNIPNSESLEPKLSLFESTCELSFLDIHLTAKQFNFLFTSLQHYEILTHLNLKNTEISKDMLQSLINCIPSFKSLSILNLSCCGLTPTSIKEIATFLTTGDILQPHLPKLGNLNLSYNFFSPKNSQDFIIILSLPSLQVLNLASCDLTSEFISDRTFCNTLFQAKQLKEINLSGNGFDDVGMLEILSFVPRTSLIKIDFSLSVSHKIDFGKCLRKFMLHDIVLPLEELHLAGCYLSNKDLLCLIEGMKFCPKLQLVNLSSNPELSVSNIIDLILCAHQSKIPLKFLRVTGLHKWKEDEINAFIATFRLKLLMGVTIDRVSEIFQNVLFNAWKDCWGVSAVCVNELLCELSID